MSYCYFSDYLNHLYTGKTSPICNNAAENIGVKATSEERDRSSATACICIKLKPAPRVWNALKSAIVVLYAGLEQSKSTMYFAAAPLRDETRSDWSGALAAGGSGDVEAEHKWPSFGKRGRGEWKRRHDTPQVEDPASQQPQKATLTIRSNTKKDVTARKEIRTVPIVRELVDELVAIGQIENAEGKVLIDTGAQVSLLKRGASSSDLLKSDVVLRGISGKVLKTYGRQRVTLNLKPGVQVPGDFVVWNLPKGYLALLGCDILGQGNGEISV
ncbi:hypothetical protein J6590_098779 [Homalodisca vitripennis]|nr:hypothetical protein J6590_098779 [Homalodisca vitripennis]